MGSSAASVGDRVGRIVLKYIRVVVHNEPRSRII